MNWTLFWILVICGAAAFVAYFFYSQREIAYLSILLYRQGNADAYLKELETRQAKFFFSRKMRTLMKIDAYLVKDDKDDLDQIFKEAAKEKLRDADRFLVLQKEMLYRIDCQDYKRVKEIYTQMESLYDELGKKAKERYKESLQEAQYLETIYVDKGGKYAGELMEKARTLQDDIPAGVCYFRAAQSYYLRGDKKQAKLALEKAEGKLRNTKSHEVVQNIQKTGDLDLLLKTRI